MAVQVLVGDAKECLQRSVTCIHQYKPHAEHREEPACVRPEPLGIGEADSPRKSIERDRVENHEPEMPGVEEPRARESLREVYQGIEDRQFASLPDQPVILEPADARLRKSI